jgi:hypothetical protein
MRGNLKIQGGRVQCLEGLRGAPDGRQLVVAAGRQLQQTRS